MRLLVAFILVVVAAQATAQTKYYQCKNARGESVFSDQPCSADAKEKSITSPQESGSVRVDFSTINASNELRDKEREIERREGNVDRLGRMRDKKLADLKLRTYAANNNLAGAQYHESLATEMQAVNSQYQSKIDLEQGKISRLYSDIEKLEEKID